MRIGHGYDVHALGQGRKLILGGVDIEFEKGLLGHSDADVLCHAIGDALLGAAALGDIGQLFPDHDETYKDASSLMLLQTVIGHLKRHRYMIRNIDATVILQRPKIAAFIPLMRENICKVCGMPIENVSIKATTTEKLGFAGREEGVAAHAVVLIDKTSEYK